MENRIQIIMICFGLGVLAFISYFFWIDIIAYTLVTDLESRQGSLSILYFFAKGFFLFPSSFATSIIEWYGLKISDDFMNFLKFGIGVASLFFLGHVSLIFSRLASRVAALPGGRLMKLVGGGLSVLIGTVASGLIWLLLALYFPGLSGDLYGRMISFIAGTYAG